MQPHRPVSTPARGGVKRKAKKTASQSKKKRYQRCLKKMKRIFTQVQFNDQCHHRLLKNLKNLQNSVSDKIFLKSFTCCLKVPLGHANDASPAINLTLDFAAAFTRQQIYMDAEADGENHLENSESLSSDGSSIVCSNFYQNLLAFLSQNADSDSLTVRVRVCQLISKIVNELESNIVFHDDLRGVIVDCLLVRLKDKSAPVRVEAVKALHKLQDEHHPGSCPIIKAFIFHLSRDPLSDVRRCIAKYLTSSSKMTINYLIERTRDTDMSVRLTAYTRLGGSCVQRLKISSRIELLERGLNENSAEVREYVSKHVLMSWFHFYEDRYASLLHALDCAEFTCQSVRAVNTIFKDQDTGVYFLNAVSELRETLNHHKVIPALALKPQNAVLWRVIAEHIFSLRDVKKEQSIAQLDDILPDLSYFCNYIKIYFTGLDLSHVEPWSRKEEEFLSEFILRQLLQICKVYDLADEVGRERLHDLCIDLLHNPNVHEETIPFIIEIMMVLFPVVDDRLERLAEVIYDMMQAVENDRPNEPDPQLMLKQTKIEVRLIEVEKDLSEAVRKKIFSLVKQLDNERKLLRRERSALTDAAIRESSLLSKLAKEYENKAKTVFLKCLTIIIEMMQDPKICQWTFPLQYLFTNFLLPSLDNNIDESDVQLKFLRALGLFCLLDQQTARKHLQFFILCIPAKGNTAGVREETLKIIFDLIHRFGFESFEDSCGTPERKSSGGLSINFPSTMNFFGVADDSSDSLDLAYRSRSTSAAQQNIMNQLIALLDDSCSEIRNTVLLGLCKLMMSRRISSNVVLCNFILMWHSPPMEKDQKFIQTLGSFLKAFAAGCQHGQRMLEQAFLPTLQRLRNARQDKPIMNQINVEHVAEFFITSTRPGTNKFHEQQKDGHIHNNMAMALCKEILYEGESDAFSRTLCKSLLLFDLCLDDNIYRRKLIHFAKEVEKIFRERKSERYVTQFLRKIVPSQVENDDYKCDASTLSPSKARSSQSPQPVDDSESERSKDHLENDVDTE